jgi:hypothetical protein
MSFSLRRVADEALRRRRCAARRLHRSSQRGQRRRGAPCAPLASRPRAGRRSDCTRGRVVSSVRQPGLRRAAATPPACAQAAAAEHTFGRGRRAQAAGRARRGWATPTKRARRTRPRRMRGCSRQTWSQSATSELTEPDNGFGVSCEPAPRPDVARSDLDAAHRRVVVLRRRSDLDRAGRCRVFRSAIARDQTAARMRAITACKLLSACSAGTRSTR